MEVSFSTDVIEYLHNTKKKDVKLFKKIYKQLSIFKENPRHPSLRTHKLEGKLLNSWSISVERNIRMLYRIAGNKAVFYKIGTHDEVYRK